MSKRILDLNTISSASNDDYLVVDGSSGTRKITPENIVGNSAVAQSLLNQISDASDAIDEMQITIGTLQSEIENIPEVIEQDVTDWLNDHPEATTTVQDGSITEAKLADALKLKTVNDYVTPEMYGAKGDGVTDDSLAVNEAFAKGTVCLKRGAVYKCSDINVVSNSVIIGNGATIDSGNKSGFIIEKTVHDVLITDINFESEFTVGDTETASNTCILIKASNTTEEYEAYNIEISRCKFNCGVFGIAATSVQNLHIHDCEFYGAVYRPEDNAGGYAILTQSCSNVTIERCYFQLGKYSRHDIYVSVSQTKTANISSRNYRISNCFSDKSLITENVGDAFFSSTIASVVVRSIYNFWIENYRLYNGTGLIFFNTTDGAVVNATIRNCINDTPRYKASSVMTSEMRQSYGFSGITGSDVKFENCKTLNNSSLYFFEYKVSGGIIEICNTTIASPFEVGDCDYLHLHELYVLGSYFRFTGTGVLKGKFHSIDSDGNYIFGASTNVANGAYIDINAYEDKLLGPWTIASNGSLTFNTGKLHIGASASVESNDHGTIITLTYCKRPSAITRTMALTDGCVIEANVSSSSIADNQVRLRKINLADGSAASSRTCRFYLC